MLNSLNKLGLLPLFLWFFPLLGSDYSIVFIHIGEKIPPYAEYSLKQARLFNPSCTIYLIANERALLNFTLPESIHPITCESIPQSQEHIHFNLCARAQERRWREGFFHYTSERFLYLADFIEQYRLENVFHLENDVLIYVNLQELLPHFVSHYKGIAATFDKDDRCIPGFIYFRNSESSISLAKTFSAICKQRLNDMQVIAHFAYTQPGSLDFLPVVPLEYVQHEKMVSRNPARYCNYIEAFNSIFDAAAYGQYLGGDDPRNGNYGPGWVNKNSIYNPSLYTLKFVPDEAMRLIPYATYRGKSYRLNNLHIHCKDLKKFISYTPNFKIK